MTLTQMSNSFLSHSWNRLDQTTLYGNLRNTQKPGWYNPKYFFPKLLNYVAGRRSVVENHVHLRDLPRGRRRCPRAAGETGVCLSLAVDGL